MTHEGRSITEKTPAFMPNNNCLRARIEELNERMHQRKEDSLNSLLSACRNKHSYICKHGLTSAPFDSSYQSPSALRPDKNTPPLHVHIKRKEEEQERNTPGKPQNP